MRKTLIATLTTVAVLGSGITALAAPEQMPDGKIFDAEYYAANNQDVAMALGTDKNALYRHYITFGINEGRLPYDNASVSENAPVAQTKQKEICKGLKNVPESMYYDEVKELLERITTGKPTAKYLYDADNTLMTWYTYEYNADGNMTTRLYHRSDGSTKYAPDTYEYDALGNLIALHDSSLGFRQSSLFVYDAAGKLVSSRYGIDDTTLEYEYDANGNVTAAYGKRGDGSIIELYSSTFKYDSNGRLIKEEFPDKSSYEYVTYEYDANGNLTGKYCRSKKDGSVYWASSIPSSRGNGTTPADTTTYAYDINGRLIAECYPMYDGSANSITYEYDANGNLIRKNINKWGRTWYEIYEYGSN